ncbi:hypothetical protein ROZALSC1DRAFT_25477, partial [Rozella allomycis CSF55]
MITEEEFGQWIEIQGFKEKFYKFVQDNQLKFDDFYSFTKEDWDAELGIAGRVIYNKLHPARTEHVAMDVRRLRVWYFTTTTCRTHRKKNILIDTKGVEFTFSDRDVGMSKLIQCEFLRFLYFKDQATDRNCHDIAILADGPGSGKSRFLMEIQSYFRLNIAKYRALLVSIAQRRYFQAATNSVDEFVETMSNAVFVNITFGNDTLYARDEGTIR